jgi:Restriction endonuclease
MVGLYHLPDSYCADELPMHISQELANALALSVRDVIWFKPEVKRYLTKSGVPKTILAGAHKDLDNGQVTVKVISSVLEQLETFGNSGELPMRKMLTTMHNWSSFDGIEEPRRSKAKASVKRLQEVYSKFIAQREYDERKDAEEREKKAQDERVQRTQLSSLDHTKLQAFRDRFEKAYILQSERERGDQFETLMNEIFSYYTSRSDGPFRRSGEQIDGLFYFDNHPYFVEIRWKKEKTKASDISVLRDRATAGFGGDTKAVFISFEGFSPDCHKKLDGRIGERVILMDGGDIITLLAGEIAFDVLLAEKLMDLAKGERAFVSASEIIARRR